MNTLDGLVLVVLEALNKHSTEYKLTLTLSLIPLRRPKEAQFQDFPTLYRSEKIDDIF